MIVFLGKVIVEYFVTEKFHKISDFIASHKRVHTFCCGLDLTFNICHNSLFLFPIVPYYGIESEAVEK